MCQYHTWFRDEEQGFVVECAQCHKIQVAFGMLLASFSESEFHRFRSYIRTRLYETIPDAHINDKTIMLNTPCESLNLLFSYRELNDFHEMLEQADTEMKTQKMLQLFHE